MPEKVRKRILLKCGVVSGGTVIGSNGRGIVAGWKYHVLLRCDDEPSYSQRMAVLEECANLMQGVSA